MTQPETNTGILVEFDSVRKRSNLVLVAIYKKGQNFKIAKNIRKKYRCVPNVISHILLSLVVWKVKMVVVRDSSVVRRHYTFLLEPWDVRELCIRKTVDLPLRLLVGTFPRFVAIGFYFLSETLI
jgi:hypothetical protein